MQTCKAEVVQHCTAKSKQHVWKHKKLDHCISEVGKACNHSCKKEKKGDKKEDTQPSTPPQPSGEKIEDNPCYVYCSNKCGGPNHDACVLDCVQRTSCTPH